MNLRHLILVAVLSLVITTSCSRRERPAEGPPVRIPATKAYENYFGPAPVTSKGSCFAFVIYFPRGGGSENVVPFPFFSFDEGSLKKIALQRLMAGLGEQSFSSEFVNPFPGNLKVNSLEERQGQVTINFGAELGQLGAGDSASRQILRSVSLTLGQFPGVTRVRILSAGRELGTFHQPFGATAPIESPSPPRLLKLVAMKEEAGSPVEELDALFDRPVTIKECRFFQPDGTPLAGELFQSMFDMAGVLKPSGPVRLAPDQAIKIRWSVVDKLGRAAKGENLVHLEIQVHHR